MPKKAKSTSFGGQKVTPAGKRHLESRAPKFRENPKRLSACEAQDLHVFNRGSEISGLAPQVPHSKVLDRKREDLKPFDD